MAIGGSYDGYRDMRGEAMHPISKGGTRAGVMTDADMTLAHEASPADGIAHADVTTRSKGAMPSSLKAIVAVLVLAACGSAMLFALSGCSLHPFAKTPKEPVISEEEQMSREYRAMVNRYLEEIALGESDRAIAESELGFVPIVGKDKDYYQYYTGTKLQYYYVRNRFYMDEFADEELDYLKKRTNDGNDALTDEDRDFVRSTFLKVISEDVEGIDGVYSMDYGSTSPSGWFAPSDNLVLGFRYDEFDLNGMSDEEWSDNLWEQRRFLLEPTNEAIAAIRDELGWETTFFVYDDFHVNPLNEQ